MIYIDTSALAAIFFRESNGTLVFGQIIAASPRKLMVSSWALTEMASVGGIKERVGAVDAATRKQALALFERVAQSRLGIEEVVPADFRVAARLIEQAHGLRAGDALHLAIAQRFGADLATLDRRLGAAAVACGTTLFPIG